jgi:hypothetical protein
MLGVVSVRVSRFSVARRAGVVIAGFVLAFVASLAFVPAASGTSPCATKVLSDWYSDGRIDDRYPLRCYGEAIDAVPSDIRDYVDAQEVIARALQEAARERGLAPPPNTLRTPSVIQDPPPKVVPVVETSAPSSIPIPLVVLASSSLVLLGTGALASVVRRRRELRGRLTVRLPEDH